MFRVRPESGEPIYRQLKRQIKHAVATGVLEPGDQLPTVRELAEELVVNPNTVARAYRETRQDGLLESTRGRGTFVSERADELTRDQRRARLRPFLEQAVAEARSLGYGPDELREELERTLRSMEAGGEGDAGSDEASGEGDDANAEDQG